MFECGKCTYLLPTIYGDKCTHEYAIYTYGGVGFWRGTSEMKRSSCARNELFNKPKSGLWEQVLWCLSPGKKFL